MIKIGSQIIKGLILDMDGVLWRGDQPLADLEDIFFQLKEMDLRVMAVTNNSTKTPAVYLDKLSQFGVVLETWQVLNSSEAAANYLEERFPQGGPVYVVGENGLNQALKEKGFYHQSEIGKEEDSILAVVAGMDRELTYRKIERAAKLIRSGIPFIGTNPDKTFPTPEGLSPGAGVVLKAIETASGVKPLIMGKPRSEIFQAALDRLGCSSEEVLMIGDRLETDIRGAQLAGCRTGLVFSGVTTRKEGENFRPPPDLKADNITEMIAMLREKDEISL